LSSAADRWANQPAGLKIINIDIAPTLAVRIVKLAESCGIPAYRVSSPHEMRSTLERALSEDRPALIEVRADRHKDISSWQFLMPRAEVS
jgi:thiamine pyrophosphate-dependent acetolactate synthase large subunit-like protein